MRSISNVSIGTELTGNARMLQRQSISILSQTPTIYSKITQDEQCKVRPDLTVIIPGCSEIAIA